jgi:hypothetical protein
MPDDNILYENTISAAARNTEPERVTIAMEFLQKYGIINNTIERLNHSGAANLFVDIKIKKN